MVYEATGDRLEYPFFSRREASHSASVKSQDSILNSYHMGGIFIVCDLTKKFYWSVRIYRHEKDSFQWRSRACTWKTYSLSWYDGLQRAMAGNHTGKWRLTIQGQIIRKLVCLVSLLNAKNARSPTSILPAWCFVWEDEALRALMSYSWCAVPAIGPDCAGQTADCVQNALCIFFKYYNLSIKQHFLLMNKIV